jgi:isopentenyl-diphosphate delta-isomerase
MNENDGSPESPIERRKYDHVDICAREDLRTGYVYWDDVKLVHNSLPEVDMDDVDTSITLFGRRLDAPIIISAMTGGYGKATDINRNLAYVAEKYGLGMGVGSQRAALENPSLAETYSVIRDFEIPLKIGNLGAPQLVKQGTRPPLDIEDARHAMELIDAHVLAVHLNYLQEVVQPEGDTCSKGSLDAIARFSKALPVIAKETGAGISREVALRLRKTAVQGIDVGGLGGTSFSAVEYFRARSAKDSTRENVGRTFWDWGIPTPVSVVVANVGLPVISTGGMRSGLDIAKAIAIGASSAGMAGRLLPAALEGRVELEREVETIISELRAAMFLVGARDIASLESVDALICGRTREWLDHLME